MRRHSRNSSERRWGSCEPGFRCQIQRYLLNRLGSPLCEDGISRMLSLLMLVLEPQEHAQAMESVRQHLLAHASKRQQEVLEGDDQEEVLKVLVDTPHGDLLVHRILGLVEPHVRNLEARHRGDAWQKRFATLKKVFSLTEKEVEVVKLIFFFQLVEPFSSICQHAEIVCLTSSSAPASSKIAEISQFTGLSRFDVGKVLSEKGTLRQMKVLDNDFELIGPVSRFLLGITDQPLSEQLFRKQKAGTVPLESHSTVAEHADTLMALIRGRKKGERLNILFYGPPGAGKTEFAKSLAAAIGYDLYEVRAIEGDDRPDMDTRFRVCAFKVCLRCLRHDRNLILVDEAENLLGGSAEDGIFSLMLRSPRNSSKPMVNELLDNGPGVRLWIVNHWQGIEESTRRRFDYAIEFSRLTASQREGLWRSALRRHRLAQEFTDADLQAISAAYDVAVGGMEVALRNYRRLARIRKPKTAEERRQAVRTVLEPHLRLMGVSLEARPRKVAGNYALDGLCVRGSVTPSRCLEMVRKFLARPKVDEETALRNFNILLYGPPGTGKTEFVKFLAGHLQRPLHQVSASEMLDRYVGGTEANIRHAFEQAEQEKAILFFDEADSLLNSRDRAQQSWEVSQVNELLCRMEAFRGVLICATNAKPKLDLASLRRFAAKLEFDYLEPAGKRLFFERLLGDLACRPLDEREVRRLDGIPCLAPGDFKVVRQQSLLQDEASRPSVAELLAALEDEAASKATTIKAKLGF